MKIISILAGCLLLIPVLSLSQGMRPTTGVTPGLDVIAFSSIQDNAVILYAIYNVNTGLIISYSVWNDTEESAMAELDFFIGDSIELEASPGSRDTQNVAGRQYFVITDPVEGIEQDGNVSRHRLSNAGHVDVVSRPDRSWPFPARSR